VRHFLEIILHAFAFYLFLWMTDELVRTVHGDFSLTLLALSLIILKEGKIPSEFGWRFFLKNLEVC
jgi:hypothetical protein